MFILTAIPLSLSAQGGGKADESKLTLQRIFASGDFGSEGFGGGHWLSKQGGYAVKESAEKGKGSPDIVRVDPATGKKEVLVSSANLVPPGGTTPLNIESFQFSPNEGLVLIFTNSKRVWRHNDLSDYWVFDITSRKLQKLGKDFKGRSLQFAKFSPDSKKVAYVYDKNVYVEDLSTGIYQQLTERKTPDIINGTFDWVYEEELDLRDGFRWSPDSKIIAFWQLDTSGVKDYHLINNTDQLYPKITTFKYPKVGETNSASKIGVVAVNGKSAIEWIKLTGDPRNHYIARMDWAPKAKDELYQVLIIQQLNRLQNTNKVIIAPIFKSEKTGDPVPQETYAIMTETDKAWVDMHDDPEWYGDNQKFLWLSERDGWRHVYAISRDGKEQKCITPGKFDVIGLVHLDEAGGALYYYASPDNATQKYLYRSKLDGGKAERITPEDLTGTNTYNVSPDGKWAIHTFSSFNTPPVTKLISLPDHKEVRVLAGNKKLQETVKKLKIKPGEFFKVDIGDDVELDAWCIKPPDFDPAKKYPVLFYVYGEPAGQTVLDKWGGSKYLWYQMLAQEGYVVMSVDNRGTPAPRGRDFRKIIYKQLGSIAPQDQAKAVQAILKKWAWADPQRVGIWGWSGGGAMTLHAMFRFPEIYRTGIAVAAVTNERFYDSIYSERYMGLPSDNVKGYKECSPITYAGQLKGNLLIVHGTGDDNVHYANAEALINELIAQNKQFTMMAYPNRTHSISEGKGTTLHLYTLMTNYLHKNLPPGPAKAEKEVNGKAVSVALVEQEVGSKEKVKELQKQRLEMLTNLHEAVKKSKGGPDPFQLFEVGKLLIQARLDLAEKKEERSKILEEAIKTQEPNVKRLQELLQMKMIHGMRVFLAELHLLELRIALEKAKLEK